MKTRIGNVRLGLLAAVLASVAMPPAGTAFAKQQPPPPGKMKKLSFPAYKEFKLKNGLETVVVEHHEQPVATVYFVFKAGSVLDPEGKASLASFVASLLNKGTEEHDSDQLAEWIESYGGQFAAGATDDWTYVSVDILSEYIDEAYRFLREVVLTPTFPEDEFEKERKRVKTALEFELSSPSAMAERHFAEVVYGDHPYAKRPTAETVEAVTRDELVAFHRKNYIPNNAILFVVGDVKTRKVKRAVKKYFGRWERGEPDEVTYPPPPERTERRVYLYHRPGSVQTNVYVGHVGLRPADPDWPAVTVGNRILGGGATGRLFLHLREDKGWTYGAYSAFEKKRDLGVFRATANVRTEVTDSALVALVDEIETIVNEPVSEEEFEDAKSYLIGNFPTTIETPNQIAGQIANAKLLGLGKRYLEEYRKRIAAVTIDDVQRAMRDHVRPDRLAIVLVGDALEIADKVKAVAPVDLFDIEGNPVDLASLAVKPSDFDFDTSVIADTDATFAMTMRGMKIGELHVSVRRSGSTIRMTSRIAGMIKMEESIEVGAGNLEPVSREFSMAAGPQTMSGRITVADGRATGTSSGPKGEREIDVELVAGTLFESSMGLVIQTLPLAEGASFRFPMLEETSGNLVNDDIEVVGAEEVTVPAGTFDAWTLRVATSDGEVILFCAREAPHRMIKQEMPAQGLTIELVGNGN